MFAIVANLCLLALSSYQCSAGNVIDRYFPFFHIAPMKGWMNDPNGFCVFRDVFHLFYQHDPSSSQGPGKTHWAHVTSKDLFNWTNLGIAIYPDQEYDKDGVWSGSAIVEKDEMIILYTGMVINPDQNNNRQALARSSDGVHVTKYAGNPVIKGDEYQPDFRDPKLWKHDDTYYMVVGNQFFNVNGSGANIGRILLFSSKDLISWEAVSVIRQSDGNLGYMWECPDFFELDGKWVLLFSPQGIEPQGDMYRNKYQVGYFIGDFDYETGAFKVTSEFKEIDRGHDFYAAQTTEDNNGRRIIIAWASMWDSVYPERDDGWAGQMTIPRVLHITPDQRLVQEPVQEIMDIRSTELYSGAADAGTSVKIPNKAGEIVIVASALKDFEVILGTEEENSANVIIKYEYENSKISLNRGGTDGLRRTTCKPDGKLEMRIFVDRSSIELFACEESFTSRFFIDAEIYVRLGHDSVAEKLSVYQMKHTFPKP